MTSSPNTLFVRVSRPDDGDTINSHVSAARSEGTNYRGFVTEYQNNLSSLSFVGGVGNTVFGSLTLTELSPQRWAISHVFVEREAREIGIGDALVQHALAHLHGINAVWVESQAQPGNRELKNLFERHGLVAQTIIVGREI